MGERRSVGDMKRFTVRMIRSQALLAIGCFVGAGVAFGWALGGGTAGMWGVGIIAFLIGCGAFADAIQ